MLCSNDRDLVGAVATVRRDHSDIIVGLVAPVREQHQVTRDLSRLTRWCRVLRPEHLARAQLPEKIPGTQLTRPDEWKAEYVAKVQGSPRLPVNAA